MKLSIIAAMAALALASGGAQAACHHGAQYKDGGKHLTKLPTAVVAQHAPAGGNQSIVGLWHVTHKVDNELLFEAFEQWHSDGTEFEFANVPPAIGDVCMGTFTKVGPNTYLVYHIGWSFDADGNSVGTFTLRSTLTTSRHGTKLSGPFEIKDYDLEGNQLDDITGVTEGERISLD
jgi:hypothetical protein